MPPPSLLLEADPPEHARARRVVTGAPSAAAVRRLTATFEAGLLTSCRATGPRGEPFDALADLAIAYPLQVFSDAVGLPAQALRTCSPTGGWCSTPSAPQHALRAGRRRRGTGPRVDHGPLPAGEPESRRDGRGDPRAGRGGGLLQQEGGMLVPSFLSAGIDTTVHGLGNALLCFAEHPEQYARRARIPSAPAPPTRRCSGSRRLPPPPPHDHPGRQLTGSRSRTGRRCCCSPRRGR